MPQLGGEVGRRSTEPVGGAYSRAPMDLEEHSLDPVIERTCAECGAKLTPREIEAAVDAGGPFLCSIHAAEQVPLADEDEPEV